MPLTQEHELHRRRFGRNLGLGLVLGGFAVLVFFLTMAKMKEGASMEGFDYQRPAPAGTAAQAEDGG